MQIDILSTSGARIARLTGDGQTFWVRYSTGEPWVYQSITYHILSVEVAQFGPVPVMRVQVRQILPR